jgi:homoserine O-acetyltransferase
MSSKKMFIFILFISISTVSFPQGKQQYADIGNFKLEKGGEILDCTIGYRTYGKMNADKSNIIIFPTWFGGNTKGLEGLIGPGKIADSTKYYIISLDAIGDGVSSSPSNSKKQPKESFPLFTVRDMVNSQHVLLTKHLNVHHVYAVIGGSMGGMQTFQWIVAYPGFMDKAVPWVGSTKMTSYDRLLWTTELLVIQTELKCGAPEDDVMKSIADITCLNITTPEYRVTHTTPEEFPKFIAGYQKSFAVNFNPYDWMSQLKAMLALDVSKPFGGSMEKAAAAVKAKVFSIVSLQDHMANPHPAMAFAKMLNAETLELNNDCGHLGPGCEMKRVEKAVNEFLDGH